MAAEKKPIYFEVLKNAENDLAQYVAEVNYERKDEISPGTYVDIKLLKRALLWIQAEDPEALSVRITTKKTNSLPFLVVETKKQDTEGEKKSAYVVAPLTTHVDRAEKFADVTLDVFMKPEKARESSPRESIWNDLKDIPAKETQGHGREEHTTSIRAEFSGVSPLSSLPALSIAGSKPPAKKRGRPKKTTDGD